MPRSRHPRRRRPRPTPPPTSRSTGPSWELPDAQFLQINWEVDDDGAPRADPAVAAPVDPAVRVVLRRPLPGVAGRPVLARPGAPRRARRHPSPRPVPRRGVRLGRGRRGAARPLGLPGAARRGRGRQPPRPGPLHRVARRPRRCSTFAVHTADVINGSDLMTFDNLHLVRLDGDGAKLVQVDPEYTIHQADRGRPVVSLPDPQALGMRGALRPGVADHRLHVPRRHRPRAACASRSTPSSRRSPAPNGCADCGASSAPTRFARTIGARSTRRRTAP